MTKQERFEIVYADQNNMRPEDFAQYRMGDTYRLPAIARAHRYFCSGWDANNAEQLAVAMNTMLYGTSAYRVDAGGFAGGVSPREMWGMSDMWHGGTPVRRVFREEDASPGPPAPFIKLSTDPDTE